MSSFWHKYWADKKTPGHRHLDPESLKLMAEEQMFHLQPRGRWLDFGCGAADILAVIAPSFDSAVGVDFSESLLKNARARLDRDGIENVELIRADNSGVWSSVSGRFNRISMSSVCQYLSDDEVDVFVRTALDRLESGGRVMIFDVIDPSRYRLWHAGFYSNDRKVNFFSDSDISFYFTARGLFYKYLRAGVPADKIGYPQPPSLFSEVARRNGLGVRFVNSMYSEYRFHALFFSPKVAPNDP